MAVDVERYSAGMGEWSMVEMASMDKRNRKGRKILAMNGCLHTSGNVARLYPPRTEAGRGGLESGSALRRKENLFMAT